MRKKPRSSNASEAVVVGLIVSSAVVVDPFGFQAFLLLRYAVTLVALLAAGVVMWRQGISLPRQRAVRIAILAFLILLLVSSMFARAPVVAVLGAAGRQLGWLAWVVFAVAFVAGLSLFDRSEHRRIETALVLGFSSAIIGVGAIALLELVGAPLVTVNQQFGSRLQASFGNPAVLGAFAVLGFPTVVGGLVGRRLPVLTGTASAVGAVLLVLSGSRGAWIGLAIGAIFAGVSIGYRRSGLTRVRIAAVAALVVVLLGITVLTGRWETALAGFEGRVATWQVAGSVVAEHPVVGVGPEGFATAFAEAVDDDYVIRYTRDDVVDRAHNGILEVATTSGIPGLLVYLVLIVAVVIAAWKATRSGDEMRPVIVGAAAGTVAYLVQQQVLFQLAVLDLSFWLVVGLLTVIAGLASDRQRMPVAAIAMLAFVAVVGIYATIGIYADHEDQAALRSADVGQAMARLEHAAVLRPSDDIHAIIAVAISGEANDPRVNARAGRIVDKALVTDPTNGTLILERSALLVDAYELSGAVGALDEAQTDLEELVSRDETNGDAFLRLGAIAYYRAQYDAARAYWMRSAYLMPHRQEPTDNLKVLGEGDG
ncbi:MAG: O-antigen ligase family protein [Actinomycetota bacterium]|nr:O-antigen ligase family protein [Actinomycetota bacterium]